MIKKIYIVLLLFTIGSVYPQAAPTQKEDVKKILEKVKSGFEKTPSYDYKLSFNFRPVNKTGIAPIVSIGRVAKSGTVTYYKVQDTENLYKPGASIRVSHEQQLIEYNASKGAGSSLPFNISDFVKYFNDAHLVDKGSYYICTMDVGKFTTLEYSRIELYINKDYSLQKQILYYLKQIPFKNKKGIEVMDYPVLEIAFVKNNADKKENLFSESNYIKIKEGKITPASDFKNYKIVDISKKQ